MRRVIVLVLVLATVCGVAFAAGPLDLIDAVQILDSRRLLEDRSSEAITAPEIEAGTCVGQACGRVEFNALEERGLRNVVVGLRESAHQRTCARRQVARATKGRHQQDRQEIGTTKYRCRDCVPAAPCARNLLLTDAIGLDSGDSRALVAQKLEHLGHAVEHWRGRSQDTEY